MNDLVAGADLLEEPGIDISFKEKRVTWDESEVPMKPRGFLDDHLDTTCHMHQDSPVIQQAESRHQKTLDADCSPTDTDDFAESLKHLSEDEQISPKAMLKQHPEAFSGGCGELDIEPIHSESKPDAEPHDG